ncbi:MAG: PQQ-binding-like beta-propeller repeat protein, partial [Pseudomonadota bacterium]
MIETSAMLLHRFVKGLIVATSVVPAIVFASCTTDISLVDAFPSSWGMTDEGTRYVSDRRTSINRSNVADLTLKWVYRLNTNQPRSFPLVTDDTIFIGDGTDAVALDRETGCERWRWGDAPGEVGSGFVLHEDLLIFNKRPGFVVAVDARSGEERWRAQPGDNPARMMSGTPVLIEGRLLVPIASLEIGYPVNFLYGCCATSGGVVALDVNTGEELWV